MAERDTPESDLADEIEALELAIGNLDDDLSPLSPRTLAHLRAALARLERLR